jgi:hypothetical protein
MPRKYIRKTKDKYDRKSIMQLKMNGEFIKEWKTAAEACRALEFDKSAVLRACKGKQKRAYWFKWKFKDDYENELAEKNNKSKS